jgi:NADH:ubiquinone oxidoreductase subunit 6 (subunit J)
MVVCAVFSAIALISSGVAAWAKSMRQAVLALWIVGLCCGAVYLSVGDEAVAVVQWIVSTLVAVAFLLYSAMLGEMEVTKKKSDVRKKNNEKDAVLQLLPLALGAGFAGIVYLGSGGMPKEFFDVPTQASDLLSVGRALLDRHFLSLEVLGLLFLLTLVGGGVVARPEKKRAEKDTEGSSKC